VRLKGPEYYSSPERLKGPEYYSSAERLKGPEYYSSAERLKGSVRNLRVAVLGRRKDGVGTS